MVVNIKVVASTLGALLFFLGVSLLLPMAVAILYGESEWWSFGVTAVIAMGIGATLWRRLRTSAEDLRIREGFAIVALAWFVLSLLGSLPFVLSGVLDSYTDAFFETMSGFTTTGATILG
ncbi:MAG: TrkH family potassium uptake protein, partial [Rhodothermales bacterium]|nr:TrkH family potassium uptake protein [Rhodothermales bacterium]